jgi:hypothetical protein
MVKIYQSDIIDKMPDNKTLTPTQQIQQSKKRNFIETYRQTFGHISNTCSAIGINRATYYDWLEKDKDFLKEIMEAEMELNDEIRDVLIKKAGEGDMTAVIFYLKKRHPDFKEQPHVLIQQNFIKKLESERKEFGV